MHTIGKNADKTWWVGRAETWGEDGNVNTQITVMFDKMPFPLASCLCNFLNGGPPSDISALWEYAV